MADRSESRNPRRIERLDHESLELRLRDSAQALLPGRTMDNFELQHLIRVITECSLLLTDVYSEERIARIMHPERGFLSHLIDELLEQQRRGDGEALYRVRRLPDDVRLVGDKALFDLALQGRREVKGYDIEELGSRAYRRAGEALELLVEDRRLRRFFKENRLLMLPLEEEVVFLRQCSEKFRSYADILKGADAEADPAGIPPEIVSRVPLMAAAAEALAESAPPPPTAAPDAEGTREPDPRYLTAARRDPAGDQLSREQLLSVYERILLFSSLDLESLRVALETTVIDQPQAVRALCDEFSLFGAGTRDLRRPPAYFLVGPTGVGKNHLVESLGRTLDGLWDLEVPILTIEGPNYTYPSDINELRGATRGFIRSDEDGILTAFHERSSRSPFSVILIDEVEKAHSQLLTFFLSILDRGTTTDNRGNVLNFSNCMFFFTSNLGYSDAQQGSQRIGYLDDEARDRELDRDVRRDLRQSLKPEFVNRVRLIHFNRLSRGSAGRILELEFEKIARRYREVHGLRIELDDSARMELIERGFSPTFGARNLTATLESICNVEIARRIAGRSPSTEGERSEVIGWLREIRDGERPFDAEGIRDKVLGLTRAGIDFDVLRVVFRDGEFDYVPQRANGGEQLSSLIESVQGLLERTFRIDSGVTDIGSFVIGDRGFRRFYGSDELIDRVGTLQGRARTLLRESNGRVRASIYLPDEQLVALEAAPPQRGLGEANVDAFAALVEEVDHLLVVAERTRLERPVTLFELELHANISKYLVLSRFLASPEGRLDEGRRLWLLERLFHGRFDLDDPEIRQRYADAERWAIRLIRGIRSLRPKRRIATLRRFHRVGTADKLRAIRSLAA